MCVTVLSRVNDEGTPQSAPRGARMVLKGIIVITRWYTTQGIGPGISTKGTPTHNKHAK